MAFDPADYTVAAVEEFLSTSPNETVRVHNLERDGRARVSLLDWIDHFAEDRGIDLTPAHAPDPSGVPITLSPDTATAGDATDITMVVNGSGFTADSIIFFNGLEEPTTLVSPSQVSTGVKPSLFVVPAVCPVHVETLRVETQGVSTQAADFTFIEVGPPPQTQDDELLTAQLRSWGLTGEPVIWAPERMQATITAIRLANTGFGTQETVQGLLDSIFPLDNIQASDVCVTPPGLLAVASTANNGVTKLSVNYDQLPPENITWLVDHLVVGHGNPIQVPPRVGDHLVELPIAQLSEGDHLIEVQVAVAGTVYNASKVVTFA